MGIRLRIIPVRTTHFGEEPSWEFRLVDDTNNCVLGQYTLEELRQIKDELEWTIMEFEETL